MKKLSALLMAFAMIASMSIFAQDAAPELEDEAPAIEQEEEKSALLPSITLSAEVMSKYMCDGLVVNPDGMLFLDAWFEWSWGLYVDLWGANDLNGYNNGSNEIGPYKNDRRNRPEEIDYVIGYAYTIDDLLSFSPLTIDVAYKYFQYPRANFRADEQIDTTIKLNNILGTGKDAADTLSAYFTWRFRTNRFGNSDRNYSWVGMEYKHAFNKQFSVALENKVFYMCKSRNGSNYEEYTGNRDCFSSLETTLSAKYKVTDAFSVKATVDCGWALDHEVRDACRDQDHQNNFNIRYGVGCSYSF